MATKALQVVITGDVKSAVAGFEAVNAEAGKSGNLFEKYGITAKKAFLAAGAGVVALGAALYKVGSEFDDAYDSIRTGTGATGQALEGLEADFRSVVAGVPNSFDDVSSAIAELNTKLGLTGPPLQDLAKQMLLLSDVTGEELGGQMDALTGLFVNFGVKVADQGRLMDELYRIYQKTGTSVTDMAKAVSMGGPAFQQLGLSVEQASAFVALMTKAGLPATRAMSSLYSVIAKAGTMGVSAKDAFAQLWKNLSDGNVTMEDSQEAATLLGSTLGPKLAGLIASGNLNYQQLVDTISAGGDTIQGAADDTFDFAEKWKMFLNNVKLWVEPAANKVFGFASALGDDLQPALRLVSRAGELVADVMRPLVSAFDHLPGPVKSTAVVLATGVTVWAAFGSSIKAGIEAVSGFAGRIVALPGMLADWAASAVPVVTSNHIIAESEVAVGVAAEGASVGVGILQAVLTGGIALAIVGVAAALHGFSGRARDGGQAATDLAAKMDGLTDSMSRSFLVGTLHDDFVNNAGSLRDALGQLGVGVDEVADAVAHGRTGVDALTDSLTRQAKANGTFFASTGAISVLNAEMDKLVGAETKHKERTDAANEAQQRGVSVSGQLAGSLGDVGQAGDNAAQAISDLSSAITSYFGDAFAGQKAVDQLASDFQSLTEQNKQAASSGLQVQNVWTQQNDAARQYRSTMMDVLNQGAAVVNLYAQQGVSGMQLKGVIDQQWQSLYTQARAAGLSDQAIAGLKGRWDQFAQSPDIQKAIGVDTSQASSALAGLQAQWDRLRVMLGSLVHINVTGGIGAATHASGGFLDEGYNIINEQGPELLRKTGSSVQVYTAGRTASMLAPTGAPTDSKLADQVRALVTALAGREGQQVEVTVPVSIDGREVTRSAARFTLAMS